MNIAPVKLELSPYLLNTIINGLQMSAANLQVAQQELQGALTEWQQAQQAAQALQAQRAAAQAEAKNKGVADTTTPGGVEVTK